MKINCEKNASDTILFAAAELSRYLNKMVRYDDGSLQIELISGGEPDNDGYDSFKIDISVRRGTITGKNDRSVLLAVYDYLNYLGCRFLAPRKEWEIVPQIDTGLLSVSYSKQASFRHRGVCIEGADSLENILDYIQWLPKLGYNSFFLQFKSPYAFLSRWYHHKENPYLVSETYEPEDAQQDLEILEREIKRRGLLLHKVGHGWTGEVLGYKTVSWDSETELECRYPHRMAMIDGKRRLFLGIPAYTNLCYHDKDAVNALVSLIVEYARNNPETDYLHIWLADEYNNLCECPDCIDTRLSDQYVAILNEVDRRLTDEKIDMRIVFLLYQELLWPPVEECLNNPKRFVLMFAPISRTFESGYQITEISGELPEFVRNRMTLPTDISENIAFLKAWQKVFNGDGFVYDYPLGRAHYGDFGYVRIARVIGSDIQNLYRMRLNGYMSCQELRAAFPNALPNYVMGRMLMDAKASVESVIEEYFTACYKDSSDKVFDYLTKLSTLSSCDYVNGIGERCNRDIVRRMEKIIECCKEFSGEIKRHQNAIGEWENIFWELLWYHKNYVILFSEALCCLASGDNGQAYLKWCAMRDYICKNEKKYQPYLDVYRVLEVTKKFTGFNDIIAKI